MAGVSRLSSSPCLATTDAKTPDEGEEKPKDVWDPEEGSPKGTAITPALSGSHSQGREEQRQSPYANA